MSYNKSLHSDRILFTYCAIPQIFRRKYICQVLLCGGLSFICDSLSEMANFFHSTLSCIYLTCAVGMLLHVIHVPLLDKTFQGAF